MVFRRPRSSNHQQPCYWLFDKRVLIFHEIQFYFGGLIFKQAFVRVQITAYLIKSKIIPGGYRDYFIWASKWHWTWKMGEIMKWYHS